MHCNRHDHLGLGRASRADGPPERTPFAQPGSERRFARDRDVDLRHVILEIDVDFAKRSLSGRATHRFRALRPGVRSVRLDAMELDITSVTLAGRPAPFRHDGERLVVEAPADLSESRDTALVIDYTCSPRRGFYFVGPEPCAPKRQWHAWSQGQDEDSRFWWPVHDQPNEKVTTEMIATVPSDHVALSNGRLISSKKQGRRKTWHWRQEQPHVPYLVTLAVGPFESLRQRGPEAKQDGKAPLPMTTWCMPGRKDDALRCVKDTPRMVELFAEITGQPYPYEKYDQVFVESFIFGGMENTSATTLTDLVLHDERASLDFTAEDLIAHELAHQWWGNLVTCRDWSQAWLNEGFATWSEVAWKQHAYGEDEAWATRRDLREEYLEEDGGSYRRPIVCRTYIDPIELFDAHIYQKGSWVVEMLRHELGDVLFRRALADYLATHRGGSVETADLRRAVERACGRSFERFFEQWVESSGYPEFELSGEWDDKRKEHVLQVSQLQSGDGTPEAFEATVEVAYLVGGVWQVERARLTRRQQSLVVALAAEPDAVAFDPMQRVLCTVKWDRPAAQLATALAQATWAPARAEAAGALGKDGSARAVAALEQALASDAFWGVQAAAAAALGEIRSEAALQALLGALRTQHPKARRAVVEALGAFRRPESAKALAGVLAKGDASYFVEGEAAVALGRTQQESALPALVKVLARKDGGWNEILHCGALDGLGHLGYEQRDAAIAALLPWARTDRFVRCQQAAARALCRIGVGHAGARERVERLVADGEFRVAHAAATALGKMGDRLSAPVLERLAEVTLDGRLRRTARESLRELRDGGEGPARKLRSELETSQAELRKLRDRLEKLEQRTPPPVPVPGGAAKARPTASKPVSKARRSGSRGRR